jgi:hypothetical protein
MYTPLLSPRRASRFLSFALGAVLLLTGLAARAQTTLYGLGTLTRNVAAGNPFFPPGGVVGDQGLATFDPVSGSPIGFPLRFVGLQSDEKLVGIAFRPSTGQLYGLARTSTDEVQLYIVNTYAAGAPGSAQQYDAQVTPVNPATVPRTSLALGGPTERVSFSFNPVADLVRVVSTNNANYRLSPTNGAVVTTGGADGPLAYAPGDPRASTDPRIQTVAYTNAFRGSTSTVLYDVDVRNQPSAPSGILSSQNPPNVGTLNAMDSVRLQSNGSFFGITPASLISLDTYYTGTYNKGYLVEVTSPNSSGQSGTNLYDFSLPANPTSPNDPANTYPPGSATSKRLLVDNSPFRPLNIIDFAIAPRATIVSLSPPSAEVGTPGLTLTVNGTAFIKGATVQFNGSDRPTTFVSVQQLTVTLTAADLATVGAYNVTVTNPPFPDEPASAPAIFYVTPPCAAPTNLVASAVTTTSATVSFTGNGSATSYTVTTVPATTTQTLPATATSVDFTGLTPSTGYTVSITTTCPSGTTAPATVSFTTNNASPTITSLSPAAVTAGAAAQTLTVNGTGFISSSTVSFNGNTRTTTFVSGTQLTIGLTAADQAMPGSYPVTVTTPAPGGGTSNTATFTVNPVACNAPSGLATSNVTSTSATVTFTGSGTAIGYTVLTAPTTPTQTLPANATSVNFTGLTPNTNYTVLIISNCAGGVNSSPATVSFTTPVAPLTDLFVSSPQNVQGSYRNVTIMGPNGVANLTGTLNVTGTLTVQNGGGLVQNCQLVTGTGSFVLQAGANLVICDPAGITASGATGAIQLTPRSFSPDASYAYNNPGTAQVTGSGLPSRVLNLVVANSAGLSLSQAVSVTQVLRLQTGNLNTSGQALTLLSSAAGTAIVDNTGGVVSGTATVQRYITPNLNPGPGYRHYSSPVVGNTVADFATAGFTPVVNPAYNTSPTPPLVSVFPNIFIYDQSRLSLTNTSPEFDKGFQSPDGTNEPITRAVGYTVNIGASALVDFVGTLNTGSYPRTGLARGPQATAGWQFLGNPYPSAINYDVVRTNSTGIEAALYVFKSNGQYTGSYTSYVNGQSTNTGTNVLPVAQGFFVRVAAGQTGAVTFTNSSRLTTYDNTLFQRTTADTRPRLTLSLGTASLRAQTVVYFEAGATAAFDAAFDAHYLPATNGLTLASETPAGERLSISGQPALTGTDVVLPLQLATATAGTYTLAVDDLSNLPAGYHAYLRDGLTGTYTDLGTTPTVSLTLAANAAAGGRYAVVFTTQARVLATAPAALAKLATVYPNPARGSATLLLPVALRGTQATAVSVVDNVGRTVLTRTLAAGAAEALELPLGGLATGVYSVQARTASGLVVKRLVVE